MISSIAVAPETAKRGILVGPLLALILLTHLTPGNGYTFYGLMAARSRSFTTTPGATVFQHPDLIGRGIVAVKRQGTGQTILPAGSVPVGREVAVDESQGSITVPADMPFLGTAYGTIFTTDPGLVPPEKLFVIWNQ
jgi:hypothetical protein